MLPVVALVMLLAPAQDGAASTDTGTGGDTGGIAGVIAGSPLAATPLGQTLGNGTAFDDLARNLREPLDPSRAPTGLPAFSRFQTLGLFVQVQQIPVLDPGYWRAVVGDPFEMERGTREKLRTTPSAMRLAFYGYYQDQLGQLFYEQNPNRPYRVGMENAWTTSFAALPEGRSEQVLGRFSGTLLGRFSPEELVDLAVYSVASQPAAPRSRERWNHAVNVAIYNAAWLAAVVFLAQLAQDQGQLRAGRWFTYNNRAWALGVFLNVRRLGFSFRPAVNGELRFSAAGVETAFIAGGELRQDPNPETIGQQKASFEHVLRVNMLRYFRLARGWEVYGIGGIRYAALEESLDDRRRLVARAALNARLEGLFGRPNTTLGVDLEGASSFRGDDRLSGGATVENTREEVALGFRASIGRVPEHPEVADWRTTAFVAFAFNAPFRDPALRHYQLATRHVLRQVELARQERARFDVLEATGADPRQLAAARARADLERRRLRERLDEFEEARAAVASERRVSPDQVEGFLSREAIDEAHEVSRSPVEAGP